MFKKIAIVIVLSAAVLLILALASTNIYYIHEQAAGTLIWDSSEAYIFIPIVRRGYHTSYLQFFGQLAFELLGDVPLPEDKSVSTVVVEVAPYAGRRYEHPGIELESYRIFDGKIFSGDLAGDAGSLWFWSGTSFQFATPEEKTIFYAFQSQSVQPEDVTRVDGWSKRTLTCSNVDDFPIEVAGTSFIVIRTCGYTGSVESIELRRSDQTSETLWSLPDRFRWISKAQYHRIFKEH